MLNGLVNSFAAASENQFKTGIALEVLRFNVSGKSENRIRRQIREIIRLSPEALSPGYDIVIVARSRAIGKAWRDQQEDLLGLLKSGGLFCRTV